MTRAHRMCADCGTELDPYEMTRCRACEAERIYAPVRDGCTAKGARVASILEWALLGAAVLFILILAAERLMWVL